MSNQLVKRNPVEGYKNVFPKTFIDAIKDRESGASLEEIIQGFNMYFLSYNGSVALTRCKVPKALRKEGLWITYVLYDHTVVTEWYNSDNIDDESWGSDSNWRKASNALVGDISISTDGYWVINGTTTNIKAQGETGTTPLLRVGDNNKIQVTYDEGKNWEDISDYIVPKFRWNQGTGTTAGTIQISMDLGNTWKDLSNPITNNLRISKYIGINESLPASGVAEGTVYMKGPYYDENDSLNENPIYRMWVYAWKGNTLAWQDNGEFTSISAGVVQERGTSTTQIMSQDAVTRELTELESKANNVIKNVTPNFIEGYYLNPNVAEEAGMCYSELLPMKAGESVAFTSNPNGYITVIVAYADESKSQRVGSIWGNGKTEQEFIFKASQDCYVSFSGKVGTIRCYMPSSFLEDTIAKSESNERELHSMKFVNKMGTSEIVFTDYPATSDLVEDTNPYVKGYEVSLEGLYDAGVRSVSFKCSSIYAGISVVPAVIIDKNENVEQYIDEHDTQTSWRRLNITENSATLWVTYCYAALRNMTPYTPQIVYFDREGNHRGQVLIASKQSNFAGIADVVCNGTHDQLEINKAISERSESTFYFADDSEFIITAPIVANRSGLNLISSGARFTTPTSDIYTIAASASSGSNRITMDASISRMVVGMYVEISEGDKWDTAYIASIEGNSLILASALKNSYTTSAKLRNVSGCFEAKDVKNVKFKGLHIDWNYPNNARCPETTWAQNGISIGSSNEDEGLSSDCEISDCEIHNGGRHGILIRRAYRCTLRNNRLSNWGEHAIDVAYEWTDNSPIQNHIVEGNFCHDNAENGIQLHGGSGSIVNGNVCNNNGICGIGSNEYVHDVIISNNICEGNANGIGLINTISDSVVIGNIIASCTSRGITMNTAKNVRISNNIIKQSKCAFAMYVNGQSDAYCEGVTIHDNSLVNITANYGIWMAMCKNSSIMQNYADGGKIAEVFRLHGASLNRISGNTAINQGIMISGLYSVNCLIHDNIGIGNETLIQGFDEGSVVRNNETFVA